MNSALISRVPGRVRRWLFWSFAAFLLYTLIGFLVLPPIIKWQLVKRLPGITKRQAAVRQVTFNPWTLSLAIRGLALTETDGRPFASWDEFYVNFQSSSLFRWAWTFKEIRLVKPFGEIILMKDGQLNFANMLEGPASAAQSQARPSGIPRVNVFQFQLTNGFVALEDRTRRSVFRTEYRPINLNLREFTTRPDSDTPYSFRAESDAGRSVAWAGDLTIQPLRSAGHLEVTGVKLSRYQPYFEDFTRAVVTNGLADLQLYYRFSAASNGVQLVVTNAGLHVAEVEVLDPSTGETVGGLRGLDLQRAQFDWRQRAVRVGSVRVTEAKVLARLEKDGRLNLFDLLTQRQAATNVPPAVVPADSSSPFTLQVDDFAIEQTAVKFEDLTRRTPFHTELKPIETSLKNFSTAPGADAAFSFRLTTEAAETLEGQGTASVNPIRSAGEVRISAVDVKKYLPYLEDIFRGQIRSGKIEGRIPYEIAPGAQFPEASVTNLTVKLTDLEVRLPESAETVTHIDEVAFERVDAGLRQRQGRVGLFRGRGGSILARRQKDGTINLLGLLAVAQTNAPAAAPGVSHSTGPEIGATNASAYAVGPWTLRVDEIQLDDYRVQVEDLLPAQPASFLLDQLALGLKGASTVSNTPISLALSFRLNERGTVAVRGTAKLMPVFADLDVGLTNLELRAAQAYIEPFAALTVANGALSTTGKLRFQTNDATAPKLAFAGDVRLTDLVTTDRTGPKELVRWDELAVRGIEAELAPNQAKVREIRLVRPRASLLIGSDRQSNLAQILKQRSEETNRAALTEAASSASHIGATNSVTQLFPLTLGRLVLDGASAAFTDESVQPRVNVRVEELSGTIEGLSSSLDSPAAVNLRGKVDGQSQFAVSGRVNPFPPRRFVDLTITNGNTQLTPLTGYMEKYAGYPLNKGRLSTILRYQVEGEELKAENKIQVDQLMLGPKNNSPDATTLPVKLGVALLKDVNGRIDLDVPLSGRLDDPAFRVGPVILKVIGNMLVKAAASPFKLLGSLVGGGGEELSFITFQPGATNLVEGESDKLTKLAEALAKRPALGLEIDAAVDPVRDRAGLAQRKLEDQLRARRLAELAKEERTLSSSESFQLEAQDRERILRSFFIEQFGTNVATVIQTNLARFASTNQPAALAPARPVVARTSWVARLRGAFGAGKRGDPAEKRLTKADREALGLAHAELMETLLAEKVEIKQDELRQLMSARARWVQDWFVQEGQVDPERLVLASPKAVDATYQGESRVALSVN